MLLEPVEQDSLGLPDVRLVAPRVAAPDPVHDQRPTRDFGHSVLIREKLGDLVGRLERDVEFHLWEVGRHVELEALGKSFGSWARTAGR